MGLRRTKITASPATNGSGTATCSASSVAVISGYIVAVHLAYLHNPPAETTDVIIAEANNSPAMPILTVNNAATDGWFYPAALACQPNATPFTDAGVLIPVMDHVKVTISQAGVGDGVTATIIWEEA